MANPLKQLAGETALYGLSTILARVINFLFVPFYTRLLSTESYGVVTEFMAYIAVLQVVLVLGLERPFDARYFVPIMGILMGNMLSVNVIALNSYYDELQREQSLYYYLLGNGATHFEAVTPFARHAVEKSFAPCIANMAVLGIVSLPGTMIGQILGGSAPGIAIKYQMMITVITFSASMLSLMLTLRLADRRSFDVYGRVRDVRRK